MQALAREVFKSNWETVFLESSRVQQVQRQSAEGSTGQGVSRGRGKPARRALKCPNETENAVISLCAHPVNHKDTHKELWLPHPSLELFKEGGWGNLA